jgi:hypothetical protein
MPVSPDSLLARDPSAAQKHREKMLARGAATLLKKGEAYRASAAGYLVGLMPWLDHGGVPLSAAEKKSVGLVAHDLGRTAGEGEKIATRLGRVKLGMKLESDEESVVDKLVEHYLGEARPRQPKVNYAALRLKKVIRTAGAPIMSAWAKQLFGVKPKKVYIEIAEHGIVVSLDFKPMPEGTADEFQEMADAMFGPQTATFGLHTPGGTVSIQGVVKFKDMVRT